MLPKYFANVHYLNKLNTKKVKFIE